jgi:hypothetical protein
MSEPTMSQVLDCMNRAMEMDIARQQYDCIVTDRALADKLKKEMSPLSANADCVGRSDELAGLPLHIECDSESAIARYLELRKQGKRPCLAVSQL